MGDFIRRVGASLGRAIASEASGRIAWIVMVMLSTIYVVGFVAERVL
jgi:hypothetical protein